MLLRPAWPLPQDSGKRARASDAKLAALEKRVAEQQKELVLLMSKHQSEAPVTSSVTPCTPLRLRTRDQDVDADLMGPPMVSAVPVSPLAVSPPDSDVPNLVEAPVSVDERTRLVQ